MGPNFDLFELYLLYYLQFASCRPQNVELDDILELSGIPLEIFSTLKGQGRSIRINRLLAVLAPHGGQKLFPRLRLMQIHMWIVLTKQL